MTAKETLERLRRMFVYVADGAVDRWRVMQPEDGRLQGDCEDFALTLAYQLACFLRGWLAR